jgi:capsular exopolysaccharide synthesis family protein
MHLHDYLSALRKRWYVMVLAVALSLGAAAGVLLLTPSKYAASVTFFVNAQTKGGVADAYEGDLFSQKRVASYVDLLKSDRLAGMIVANHPIGLSSAQIQREVSAQPVPNTVLLKATVTDVDRNRALRLTSAVADQFVVLVRQIETPPGGLTPTVRVEVVAGPGAGHQPVSPNPVRIGGFALVLGFVVGIVIAVLREALDTTVRSGRALPGPVLAAVPFETRAQRKRSNAARTEAMRRLRASLLYRSVKTVAITSAVAGEGKSTVARNLAVVMAEAGRRVVLVDTDPRRPRFDVVGLTDVLAERVTLDEALQPWNGLVVLTFGTEAPDPGGASERMTDLLATLRDRFDVVVIDTPPLVPFADAAVLSSVVDGTVLVVRYGKTPAAQVHQALESLGAVDAEPVGYVLNAVPGARTAQYKRKNSKPRTVVVPRARCALDQGATDHPNGSNV